MRNDKNASHPEVFDYRNPFVRDEILVYSTSAIGKSMESTLVKDFRL